MAVFALTTLMVFSCNSAVGAAEHAELFSASSDDVDSLSTASNAQIDFYGCCQACELRWPGALFNR